MKQQTNQPFFLRLCFPLQKDKQFLIDFRKEHLLLNSTTQLNSITSYPTQNSLVLTWVPPHAMVLHNRLQSHLKSYKSPWSLHAARTVYWMYWFVVQLSLVVTATVSWALGFFLNSRSSGVWCPLFGYGSTSHFSSGYKPCLQPPTLFIGDAKICSFYPKSKWPLYLNVLTPRMLPANMDEF